MKKKKEKHPGVAKEYPPIHETVENPLGTAVFEDTTVRYRLKGANGRKGAEVRKTYPGRHAARILHGRLRGDATGAYLLALVQRIQLDQQKEAMRKRRLSL